MGMYNTFQFLGVFFGGFLGGTVYGQFGITAVFAVCGLMLVAWVYLVHTAPKFRLLDSLVVKVGHHDDRNCQALLESVEGVEEVIIFEGESIAYLKVDKEKLDQNELDRITMVSE